MDVKKTFRIGFCPFYPVPAGTDQEHSTEYFIERSAELGCTATQVWHVPMDPDARKRLRDLAAAKNVELEVYAMGVFELAGPDAAAGRQKLLASIALAKELGATLIRTGYGRLSLETSRFNRNRPLAEHLGSLVANLKEAARIVGDAGIPLAIENHCDFTGRQMAQVFAEVGSPLVGAALDTANGYTVYCDPDDDVQDLAPYTITTHIKDMAMIDARDPGLIPLIPVGCAVGDGNVNIPQAIQTLAEKSPYAQGLHLIIEIGWWRVPEGQNENDYKRDLFERSIRYLQGLL